MRKKRGHSVNFPRTESPSVGSSEHSANTHLLNSVQQFSFLNLIAWWKMILTCDFQRSYRRSKDRTSPTIPRMLDQLLTLPISLYPTVADGKPRWVSLDTRLPAHLYRASATFKLLPPSLIPCTDDPPCQRDRLSQMIGYIHWSFFLTNPSRVTSGLYRLISSDLTALSLTTSS